MIRESKDVDTIAREEVIALTVMVACSCISEMRLTVNLDGESHTRCVKVDDHPPNRMLPPESHAELPISDPLPEHELGCWHGRAEARADRFELGGVVP